MKLYPVNVIDLQDMFPTEKACEEYLLVVRWPEGFVCPHCLHTEVWKLGSGRLRCVQCQHDVSLTAGTIFHDSPLSLRLWFQALWYVVCQKQGVSALALKGILGLGSYKTAWEWLHKLRRAMVRPGRDRLSGVVEVDEILIGGPRKGKEGRGALGKAMVLVAVEDKDGKDIGRIRLMRIENASHASISCAQRNGRARKYGAHRWMARIRWAQKRRLPPHHHQEGHRSRRRKSHAACASCRVAPQAMAFEYPRRRAAYASSVLSRRVCLPLQPAYLPLARAFVLPTHSTGAHG